MNETKSTASAETSWGVFYDESYKRRLIEEHKTYDDAYSEALNWSFNNEGDENYFVAEVTDEDRGIIDPDAVSGSMTFTEMTDTLDVIDYDVEKLQMWVSLYNDRRQPTKWGDATPEGTVVDFNYIKTEEARLEAKEALLAHVDEVNTRHGMNISLKVK